MSTNLQAEYSQQKYGSINVGMETLESDQQFWVFIESEVTKKISFAESELKERLKLQDSRRTELDQLKAKIAHYEANGLTRKDEEMQPLLERADMLSGCLRLTGIETDLQNQLEVLHQSLENAKLKIKRAKFKTQLAQGKEAKKS